MGKAISHWLAFFDEDEYSEHQEALGAFPYDLEDGEVTFRSDEEKELYQELMDEKKKHPQSIFTTIIQDHELTKLNL